MQRLRRLLPRARVPARLPQYLSAIRACDKASVSGVASCVASCSLLSAASYTVSGRDSKVSRTASRTGRTAFVSRREFIFVASLWSAKLRCCCIAFFVITLTKDAFLALLGRQCSVRKGIYRQLVAKVKRMFRQ